MVYGETRDLQVYNAGLWVSLNWTYVLQVKQNRPSEMRDGSCLQSQIQEILKLHVTSS